MPSDSLLRIDLPTQVLEVRRNERGYEICCGDSKSVETLLLLSDPDEAIRRARDIARAMWPEDRPLPSELEKPEDLGDPGEDPAGEGEPVGTEPFLPSSVPSTGWVR